MFKTRVSEYHHFTSRCVKTAEYKDKSLIPINIGKLLSKQKKIKLRIMVIRDVFDMTIQEFAKCLHENIDKLINITVRPPYIIEIEDKR